MLQSEAQQQVERDLPWNFTVNLLDISFYMLGLTVVARQTILPVLVSQLTSSKLALGLIPAIDSLGFLLPQLLLANYTESLRRKLPFVAAIGGAGERLPYLIIAIVLWWFAVPAPTATVIVLFMLLTMHTFSGGIITPAWYDLIAKVIPARRRGFWFGLGHGVGALMGIAGAALTGWVLVAWPYPQNYSICFLLAFVMLMISWGGLVLNREPDSSSVKSVTPLVSYIKQLPAILRRDDNYVRYLLTRAVGSLGAMATGFYAVYGIERWSINGEGVAILTAILTGSQAIMYVVWGMIGDHKGHKLVLTAGSVAIALAALAATFAVSALWLWGTFALLGSAIAATSVSSLNIVLEFCAPEERPTYIGLTNSLLAPLAIAAPLIGGVLAMLGGYRAMFVVAAVCAALAALLMVIWVREPRREATA